jgi:transcriptional regulator with XRE-family HTH domain
MTETMTFGEAVRQLRLARGMTQPELAAKAEISKGMVSMVETGRRVPSWAMAKKMIGAVVVPRHVSLALLSVGGYTSRESRQDASLEIRAYLNALYAPENEIQDPPRVIEGYTGLPLPRTPERG